MGQRGAAPEVALVERRRRREHGTESRR
jgi:hypothetical protein